MRPLIDSGSVYTHTDLLIDVGGLGAGLEAIEMNTIDAAEIPEVVEIQNANRLLYTELQDTLNDIARFITRPPQGLQSLKKRAPAYVAGGAVVGLLAKGPSAVVGFHPKATSPGPSQPTETTKGEDDEFVLLTVPGTTVEAFHKFIPNLPDKGIGEKVYYDWPSRYQTYLGHMTLEQAKTVNQDPIVNMIAPNKITGMTRNLRPVAGKNHEVQDSSSERNNRTKLVARNLGTRRQSDLHLRMISADPSKYLGSLHEYQNYPLFDYTFDESLGHGVTIYVIDSGFDFRHKVS